MSSSNIQAQPVTATPKSARHIGISGGTKLVALAVCAVIVLGAASVYMTQAGARPSAIVFPAVVIIALAVAAAVTIDGLGTWDARDSEAYTAGLVALMPFVPGIAGVVTVIAYLARVDPQPPAWNRIVNDSAVLIGSVSAIVTWLILAFFYRHSTGADRVNTNLYSDLCLRCNLLGARINAVGDVENGTPTLIDTEPEEVQRIKRIAFREACGEWRFIQTELGLDGQNSVSKGLRWVLMTGYVNLWRRLHTAEQALLLLEPNALVVSSARYDELRLKGSNIDERDDLLAALRAGRMRLSTTTCFDQQMPPQNTQLPPQSLDPTMEEQWEVRAVLREIRRSLDEFRDESRMGLVLARNRVIRTGAFTGLAMFVLAGLAVIVGRHPELPAMIVAAATFYLIGALVGLFGWLRTDSESERAIEDYDLSSARLVHRPLFSGLAALGGVALVGMLSQTLNSPLTPTLTNGVQGASTQLVPLDRILSLSHYPFGLLIAALFGNAPTLLIRRLEENTDKFTADLKSSTAGARAESPSK